MVNPVSGTQVQVTALLPPALWLGKLGHLSSPELLTCNWGNWLLFLLRRGLLGWNRHRLCQLFSICFFGMSHPPSPPTHLGNCISWMSQLAHCRQFLLKQLSPPRLCSVSSAGKVRAVWPLLMPWVWTSLLGQLSWNWVKCCRTACDRQEQTVSYKETDFIF